MNTRLVVTVRGDREVRFRLIGNCRNHLLSGQLEGNQYRIAINRAITVEEAAKVFDVADTDSASFNLRWHDDTGLDELLGQCPVSRRNSVVGGSVVEVDSDLWLCAEHDLAGKALVTSAV